MFSMSALHRLAWLRDKVCSGVSVQVSVSSNPETGYEKVRFVLGLHRLRQSSRVRTMQVITMLQEVFASSVVVDKGHSSYTTGKSEIFFWIKPKPVVEYDVLPPPAPPPMESSEAVSVPVPSPVLDSSLALMSEKLQHIEQLCLHLHTNMHLLYPMQSMLEALPQRLEQFTLSASMGISETLDALAVTNNKLVDAVDLARTDLRVIGGRMNDVQIQNSDNVSVVHGAPMAEISSATTFDASVQTVCLVEDAELQVTARMIEDALEDLRSEAEEVDADLPMSESSESSEDENFVPLDKEDMKSSRFWHKRVFDSHCCSKGTVVNIGKNSSGTVLYQLRYDIGGTQFVTRERVKKFNNAYESLKTTHKSSSSRA